MRDLLLDESGDLELDATGDIQFTDSIKQAIAVRLKWFAEEWRLGPDLGLPYYNDVFVKNPNYVVIQERIREAIFDVDGVDEIISLEMSHDTQMRKLQIKYSVSVLETESYNNANETSGNVVAVTDVLLF